MILLQLLLRLIILNGNTETGILRRVARGFGGSGPYTDHTETDDTITAVTETDDTITAVTDHGDTVQDGPRQVTGGRRGPRCMIYVNADGNTVEDNTDGCDAVQGGGGGRRIAKSLVPDGPYTDH